MEFARSLLRHNGLRAIALGGLASLLLIAAAPLASTGGKANETRDPPRNGEAASARASAPKSIPPAAKAEERLASPGGKPPTPTPPASWQERFVLWVREWALSPDNFSDFLMVVFTAVLTGGSVFQWFAIKKNAKDVERSLAEAARAATAMEGVASELKTNSRAAQESVETIRDRTARQIRAYLAVSVGGGFYQDRRRGVKFALQPVLVNYGATPAHEVRFRAKAAIIPAAEIDAYRFTLPAGKRVSRGSVVPPREPQVLYAEVEDFVSAKDAAAAKAGRGPAIVVWGVISYRDVFNKLHRLVFAYTAHWRPDGNVTGFYLPKHNRSN